MDDDAPLSMLAVKPQSLSKKSSADDDTPLSMLAVKRVVTKPGKSGAPAPGGRGRPSVPGAPKVPGEKLKRKKSSSSSSSSSDSSDSSDSKKPKKKKAASKTKLKKSASQVEGTEEELETGKVHKSKDRSAKEQVVAEILCRWWFCLPDWPPNDDSYYDDQLKKRSMRKVKIEEWEWVNELDSNGCAKAYELSQFRGVFRNTNGDFLDLRPADTCPCYTNLMKKDMAELYGLLQKAFETQLVDLKKSTHDESMLEAKLKADLTRATKRAADARALGSKK